MHPNIHLANLMKVKIDYAGSAMPWPERGALMIESRLRGISIQGYQELERELKKDDREVFWASV